MLLLRTSKRPPKLRRDGCNQVGMRIDQIRHCKEVRRSEIDIPFNAIGVERVVVRLDANARTAIEQFYSLVNKDYF